MGRGLFDTSDVFRDWIFRAAEVCFRHMNFSLVDLLYGKKESLVGGRAVHTNPALFAVQYALTMVLMERGVRPTLLVGTSLGEYMALTVSGAISFEDVLKALMDLALCVEENSPPGGMLSLFCDAALLEKDSSLLCGCDVAARYFPGHTVVSGTVDNLGQCLERAKARQTIVQPVDVRLAFHSSAIEPAREPFMRHIADIRLEPCSIPIISCVDGAQITTPSKDMLWNVVRQPILFADAIANTSLGNTVCLDLGPSGILGAFTRFNCQPEDDVIIQTLMESDTVDADEVDRRLLNLGL